MLGRLLLLCAAAAATRNESVLDLAPRFAERASAPSSVDDDGELEISAFKVCVLRRTAVPQPLCAGMPSYAAFWPAECPSSIRGLVPFPIPLSTTPTHA